MSKYDKASLVQIPSGYKSGTLYSVLPNTADGDFDFTRGSTATRVNKDGLIETVSANVPRLNYNFIDGVVQPDPHLLLEPTSTNLLQRSEDYANGYWLKARVGSNATGFTAPDGSNNATYFEQASGQTTAAVIFKSAFTSASSGVYTFSIWAKKAEKRYLKLQTRVNSATYRTVFDLQDGVITYDSGNENAKIEEYPNGWYRLSVQRTSTTTDDIVVYYYLNDSAGASDTVTDSGGVYIWGSQVEKNDYITSYIPTTTAQVTRATEVCNGAGTANDFNDSEGVLYANIAALANDLTYRVFGLSDGSTSNRIIFYYNPNSNNIELFISSGGASQTTLSSTLSDIKLFQKVAVKYKSNDIGLWINGFEVGTDTNATMPSGLNKFAFDNSTGAQNFYGKTKEIGVYDAVLTDAELEALTSYTSFTNMANELNLTIK